MLVVVVPSAIVGARLFSVLDNYGYYSRHLLDVVRPPYIGLAIYGVLTGGILLLGSSCSIQRMASATWVLGGIALSSAMILS